MAKNNHAKAVLELRDALQLEPRNGSCHALLGAVHLKQGQGTMARIHFDKALDFEPTNAIALEGKKQLEKNKKNKPGDDNAGGGLFGLFGKKK